MSDKSPYGEYDPKLTELMVLESILNGSRGVTYYWFGGFGSMDFYYHSKAISESLRMDRF